MSKLPTVNNKMEKAADLFLGKFSYSQFVGKIKQMTLENYWTNKEKLGKKVIEIISQCKSGAKREKTKSPEPNFQFG